MAAQVLPSTGDLLPVLVSISSPGRAWIFLFCWAAPSRGRSFLVAMDRQPGVWFLLGLCVQTAASATPTHYFSTWKKVQAEERLREWWQGQSQQCRAAGDTQPWLGERTARASISSESLQGPPWPWGPVGSVGSVGSVPLGCSSSPALLQVLLIAGRVSQHWELFSGCCW